MPSLTPERRRHSSISSAESGKQGSSKHSEEPSRKNKESRNERHSSHRKSTSSRNDKIDERKNRRGEHSDDSHHKSRKSYRSRSRSKSRERPSDKNDRSRSSRGSHHRSHNRDSDKAKFDASRVVVKQEVLSDEEDERRRRRNTRAPEVRVKPDPNQESSSSYGKPEDKKIKEEPKPKEKPNFQVSGKLAEDTNIFNGVVVKYNEPPEAKKPAKKWRLYAFKGDQALPMLPIHRQSAFLLGRDRKVADIPIDHPSCSKQHAVLQFRAVTYTKDDGTTGKRVRPYIIDLESANGTFVNNQKIEARRYVELFEKDVVKFGFSSREYVLLHEGSTSDDVQDDELNAEEAATNAEEATTDAREATDVQE